jgi:hypothetical protein
MHIRIHLLIIACCGGLAIHVRAEGSIADAKPQVLAELVPADAMSSQPAREDTSTRFNILKTWETHAGDHRIIYNRIAPPVLRTQAAQSTPVPSLQYLQWLQARELKASKYISLGATVYDGQFSDVRWSNGDQWVRVISNINFDYLTGGMGEFETADTIYQYFLMSSDDTSAGISDSKMLDWLAQARLQLSPAGSSYLIVDGNAVNDPEALADLDALHAWFTANKDKIVQDYQQQAADMAAREIWRRAHPPVQKDTIINFWPVKSRVYLKGANQ